jgi:hypothetical protein
MSECIYFDECSNRNKSCFKCFNFNMYKPIKEIRGLQHKSNRRKEKKDGMDLEKRGTMKYNQAVKYAKDVARRQRASGALHYALGDMITEEQITAALAEYKERGQISVSGEKQITIKKEWLKKLADEAKEMRRDYYFLPFAFKGDEKIYVAMDYDLLLSYVQTIQFLAETNSMLKELIANQNT